MDITTFLTKWDSKYIDGQITEVEVPKSKAKELGNDVAKLNSASKKFVVDNVLSEHVRKLIDLPKPRI